MKEIRFKKYSMPFLAAIVFACFAFTDNKPVSITGGDAGTGEWRTVKNNAFKPGEKLKYRLHYGFINAGRVEIMVKNEPVVIDGRATYHIDGYGRSIPSFDWMFKVRDHFQSYVDTQSMLPLRFVKDQEEGGYKDNDYASFNYSLKKCFNKKGSKDIPADVQDVISIVYYARTLDMRNIQPGKEFPISIYMDNEVYNLSFKFIGREVLKTDVGKINTLKFTPKVIENNRVFNDGDNSLTFWVSDDENKIPLRIKADLLIGSIKCDITDVEGLKHAINKAK